MATSKLMELSSDSEDDIPLLPPPFSSPSSLLPQNGSSGTSSAAFSSSGANAASTFSISTANFEFINNRKNNRAVHAHAKKPPSKIMSEKKNTSTNRSNNSDSIDAASLNLQTNAFSSSTMEAQDLDDEPICLSDQTEIYLSDENDMDSSLIIGPVKSASASDRSDKTEVYSVSSDNEYEEQNSTNIDQLCNQDKAEEELPDLTPPSSHLQLPEFCQNHGASLLPPYTVASSPQSASPAFTQVKVKPKSKSALKKANLKEQARMLKEEQRRLKQEERQRKALEKLKEAAMKKAEREARKAAKPGESHRHMIIEADSGLQITAVGVFLEADCVAQGVSLRFTNHSMKNSIRFKRKLQPLLANVSESPDSEALESHIGIIMEMEEMVEMMHAMLHPGKNQEMLTLIEYAHKVQDVCDAKATLLVLGCEKYFRDVKTQKNRVYRDNVLGTQNNSKKNRAMTKITRVDYEECLVELEMICDVAVINHESEEELSHTVMRMNKSLAEAPYKRDLYAQEAYGGKPMGLKIDKEGYGALKVWQRMLEQLHGSSADYATAIAAEWMSPRMLHEEYSKVTQAMGESLLEDIEIRRGGGVLQTRRRVGPEMSRRIYEIFMKIDPNVVIK